MNKFEISGIKGDVRIAKSKKNDGSEYAFIKVITLGEGGSAEVEVAVFDPDQVAKVKALENSKAKGLRITGTIGMQGREVKLRAEVIEDHMPKL